MDNNIPIEIWMEIMNYQPVLYGIVSRLDRRHHAALIAKLKYYKTLSCRIVVDGDKKYSVLPNGDKHGNYSKYYTTGQVEYECNYIDGRLHGKCIEYYTSGRIACEYNYIDGRFHGKFIGYTGGLVEYEANYVNGKLHGKYICYYTSGQVLLEYNYNDGKRVCDEIP